MTAVLTWEAGGLLVGGFTSRPNTNLDAVLFVDPGATLAVNVPAVPAAAPGVSSGKRPPSDLITGITGARWSTVKWQTELLDLVSLPSVVETCQSTVLPSLRPVMKEAGSLTGAFWPLDTFADVRVFLVLVPSTQYEYVAARASLSASLTVEVRAGGVVATVLPIKGYGAVTSQP